MNLAATLCFSFLKRGTTTATFSRFAGGWAAFLVLWLLSAGSSLVQAQTASATANGGTYEIADHGHRRTFVLAMDELQPVGERHPVKIPPATNQAQVEAQAEALSRQLGGEARPVLYEQGKPRAEWSRRILTRDVLVEVTAGTEVGAMARASGAVSTSPVTLRLNHYFVAAARVAGALELADKLRAQPGVISAEAQLAWLPQKKTLPDDPLFAAQWHLKNTGQGGGTAGVDINVTNVWDGFRGRDVVIGIVDDGLQSTHPDLAANVNRAWGYDFNGHDSDPTPFPGSGDFHGTAVAGVAAACGNNGLGGCGAAYEATLVGLRLTALPATDAEEAAAMLHSNAVIQIKNNSWGPPDCPAISGATLSAPGPLMKAALALGVSTGRNGKGVIYAWAAGNGLTCGENINYDGYANSIHVIPVAALSDRGGQASYSEPGACLVVSAPSNSNGRQGITTTDLVGNAGYNPPALGNPVDLADLNYTDTFGGTSSAAPLVSGVVALMLQANPNLNYRDVKEILLRSATREQSGDGDWTVNSGGIPHNHKFGAGLVNALAAVTLATNWTCLGPVTNLSSLQSDLNLLIPDYNSNGITRLFTFTNAHFRVEHLTLTMAATHLYWGDLAVTVTSPSGVRSRLAEMHSAVDTSYSYHNGWTFSSVRHWAESAEGTWTVNVADLSPGITGSLQSLELTLYGSTPRGPVLAIVPGTNHTATVTLFGTPGWKYGVESSTNLVAWTQSTNLVPSNFGQASFFQTNILASTPRFYRARLLP